MPPRLVHETPRRLRLSVAWLADPRLDQAALRAAVAALPGVGGVRCNPAARSLAVAYDGEPAHRRTILAGVAALDPAALRGAVPEEREAAPDRLGFAGRLAAALFARWLPRPAAAALAWGLAGHRLLRGADTLAREGVRVEVLDAVAVGLTLARSEYATALVTDSLLHLGATMEHESARDADELLLKLMLPEQGEAWVRRGDVEIRLPLSAIAVGDLVLVGPGERIPVDGEVVEGVGAIDQSTLTGESAPLRREAGDPVSAGGLLAEGQLVVLAQAVGAERTTARINRYLLDAVRSRAPMQALAESLADRRVLYTLGLGAGVFAFTRDPRRLASVFLVDYACALKLVVPVSFKAALHRSAREGVLLKGGPALEALAAADTIVFDKTGTLTHGDLALEKVVPLAADAPPEERILTLAASVTEHSNHPVSHAVVRAARARGLGHMRHGTVEHIVAHGIKARMNGAPVAIGSRHYLEEHEGVDFAPHEETIAALDAEGLMPLFVARDRRLLAVLGLRDRLRDEAATVLLRLRELGLRHQVMLTGDRAGKAERLAHELRIDEVRAQCAPEDKAEHIRALRAAGRRVVFVGDGVNDGPALACADVGFSLPGGADLTRQTADAVLLRDDLWGLVAARSLAGQTEARIRASARFAEIANTAVLFGAVSGRLGPTPTALLHNGTTIGLLLRALTPPQPPKRRLAG